MVSRVNTLNTDLKNYVVQFKGRVDKNLCDTLVREIDTMQFEQHTFYDARTGEFKPRSGSQELSMSWGNVSTKNKLNKFVDDTAFKYVQELKMPWFDKYQGYSHVRFNKYAENKKMALHADHIHSIYDGETQHNVKDYTREDLDKFLENLDRKAFDKTRREQSEVVGY